MDARFKRDLSEARRILEEVWLPLVDWEKMKEPPMTLVYRVVGFSLHLMGGDRWTARVSFTEDPVPMREKTSTGVSARAAIYQLLAEMEFAFFA